MAKFHPRGVVALLFLVLLLASPPSRGETRRSGTGRALPPAVSLQEEATRIIRLVFGCFSPKTGNTLDPDGSPRQIATQERATPDTGNTLDPNG